MKFLLDDEETAQSYWLKFVLISVSVTILVVLLGTGIIGFFSSKSSVQTATESSSNPPQQVKIFPVPAAPTPDSFEVGKQEQKFAFSETAYGHYLYPQADANKMIVISSYGMQEYQRFEFLDPEAGKALMKMIYAARDEGVWIVPVSGFRTIEQQDKLFQSQIKRRGSKETAAKISAPPGYSEHHTGFAVDLTDGNFPKQDVTGEFEKTQAYQWLTRRAKEFGFELSFPENNPQGVSYEPWHWRFVGSPDAAAIFANARN